MRTKIFVIVVVSLLISCGKMVTGFIVNNYNGTFMVWHYTNGTKDVQFIPMSHMNKPEKFARIKQIADSLRSKGYVIYYESVSLESPNNKYHNDTIQRKFRKVVGIIPGDYSDKDNDSYNSYAIKGFIMQTATNTGLDRTRDIHSDLSMDTLIQLYEKERGKIMLKDCDWSTPLSDKYNCQKLNINDQKFILLTLRNRYLAHFVTHSKDKKIVIMYGAEHHKNFEDDLKKIDSNWQMIHNTPSIRW